MTILGYSVMIFRVWDHSREDVAFCDISEDDVKVDEGLK